ncbi:MAG: hypothetical protein BroJett021_35180 [Chloroflexota bacterium]|nr:MAG: hypothetical protein BroJett021_35180 [Chloroflexota bacterium]
MLTYRLLKNHAGLLLTGDYQTLRALHEVIHNVNERSPLVLNTEGAFLGLAYDVRKAYEGQRRKVKPPDGYPEIGPRFGVEILWPVLLWQSRVLRASMGFIDTSKHMQANAYALEAVIQDGLKEDFGAALGESVIFEWERIDPAHPFPEEALQSRTPLFCSWTKAQRKAGIVGLIASFSPMYSTLYPIWLRNGATGLVSPQEFKNWENAECPDPKW